MCKTFPVIRGFAARAVRAAGLPPPGQPAGVQVTQALAEAGATLIGGAGTAAEVAARLKAARCEGSPGNPLRCPLARWFGTALRERRLLGRRQVVAVDGATWGRPYLYVHICERSGRQADGYPAVPVPTLLASFAAEFDGGAFPELRLGGAPAGGASQP